MLLKFLSRSFKYAFTFFIIIISGFDLYAYSLLSSQRRIGFTVPSFWGPDLITDLYLLDFLYRVVVKKKFVVIHKTGIKYSTLELSHS